MSNNGSDQAPPGPMLDETPNQNYLLSDNLSVQRDKMITSSVAPFLSSLYEILDKEDPRVIGWCDDGKSFCIYDYEAMEERILPTYFRHKKFASFQRQLNYFGFRKIHKTNREKDTSSAYCQANFVRNDPSLMLMIKRKTHRVVKTPTSLSPLNSDFARRLYTTTPIVMGNNSPIRSQSFSVEPPASKACPSFSRHSMLVPPMSLSSGRPTHMLPHAPTNINSFEHYQPFGNPFLMVNNDETFQPGTSQPYVDHVKMEFDFKEHLMLPVSPEVEAMLNPFPFLEATRDSFRLSPEELMMLSQDNQVEV
jgi:hypothetical protein